MWVQRHLMQQHTILGIWYMESINQSINLAQNIQQESAGAHNLLEHEE
jgi:hypothetical protein